MPRFIKELSQKVGIDGAIAFTILTRVIQASGGIISIIFIAKYLSPNEQGFYYTFASLIAIQVFFELGLFNIITQYTAYEFAHLKFGNNFTLIGEEHYKSRLSSLLRFCIKWFSIVAVILFFALLIAGYTFFNKYNNSLNIEWQKPWVLLCLTTALNLFIDPILAFFEGLGQVKDMSKVRLVQKSVNIALLFIFFALGFKLYSSPLASLVSIAINYIQILFSDRIKFLKAIWSVKATSTINYYQEIFPYQWRIAVSWISGYFIFQLFNPILFATEGPIVAGQMGMTMAALTGIAGISMSWINTKVPLLSMLISKKEYNTLDSNFRKISVQSVGINFIITIAFFIVVEILVSTHYSIASRFLTVIPLACMCLASMVNQIIFAIATYLRCHKKEPMLLQSITMGILVSLSTIVLGKAYGLIGITGGYNILTCLLSLPWTIYTFLTKKSIWHK